METYQKHIIILLLIYLDVGLGIYFGFDIMWKLSQSLWCFVILILGSEEPKDNTYSSILLDFYSDGGTGTM